MFLFTETRSHKKLVSDLTKPSYKYVCKILETRGCFSDREEQKQYNLPICYKNNNASSQLVTTSL